MPDLRGGLGASAQLLREPDLGHATPAGGRGRNDCLRRELFELIFADKPDEATVNPDLVGPKKAGLVAGIGGF